MTAHDKDALQDRADRAGENAQPGAGEEPAAPSKFAFFKTPPAVVYLPQDPDPNPEPEYADTWTPDPLPSPDILDFQPPPAPAAKQAKPPPTSAKRAEAAADWIEDEGEVFERAAGGLKLGIIGGKGVGKSYLFQAMVARSFHADKAGALAYYLDTQGIVLHTAIRREDPARLVNPKRFVDHYSDWKRIAATMADTQRWYRLSLPYRTGLLGRGRSLLEVEFFEASGEGLLELEYMGKEELGLWKEAYLDAPVMVFCLPLWAAFPDAELPDEDWQAREQILKGFYQVVFNYQLLREKHRRDQPVRGILALTMADDPRSALADLRDRWITPYLDDPETYLQGFAHSGGVARYMANARKISAVLHGEFKKLADFRVGAIPNMLNFNGGPPWLIPLSAIEGKKLDIIESQPARHRYPGRFQPPVPVHVELPLLVALCERENALM